MFVPWIKLDQDILTFILTQNQKSTVINCQPDWQSPPPLPWQAGHYLPVLGKWVINISLVHQMFIWYLRNTKNYIRHLEQEMKAHSPSTQEQMWTNSHNNAGFPTWMSQIWVILRLFEGVFEVENYFYSNNKALLTFRSIPELHTLYVYASPENLLGCLAWIFVEGKGGPSSL